jgi:two-component system, OmpR family, response regulator ChvI
MTIIIQAKNYYFCPIFNKKLSFYYSDYDNPDQQHYHSGSSSPCRSLQNREPNTSTISEGATKEPPPVLKRILIVDDDPDITLALKTVLEDNGYAVHAFNDPTNAVSNFKQPGMYDLLIIDLVMPNMDGFDLYERVKKIDNKVKACFITAYDVYSEALREIYPNFEVDCFMKKPIENEDLLRKVMNATM